MELPTLQLLLGHRWLSSTTIYLHVSQQRLDEAQSPFDQIDMGHSVVKTTTGETNLFDNREVDNEINWGDEP
jgi:site-specific recombinase XerC